MVLALYFYRPIDQAMDEVVNITLAAFISQEHTLYPGWVYLGAQIKFSQVLQDEDAIQ